MRAGYIEAPYKAYFKEVEEPQIVSADQVKIQVKCTGICGSEVSAYHGTHPYRIPPLVSGHEFAGVIAEVGADVKGWKVGDRVIAEPQYGCGSCELCQQGKYNICPEKKVLGATYWSGSFGEYVVVPQQTLVKLPDEVPFEHGALVEPLAVGLHAVKISGCTDQMTVLILGSGTIGMSTLLTAKLYHPTTILAARRDFYLDKAKEMGCDYVINDHTANLEEEVMRITGGRGADITYVCFGSEEMMSAATKCTKRGGLISVIALLGDGKGFPYGALFSKELMIMGSNMYVYEDFEDVMRAIGDGRIDPSPMVSRTYPIEQVDEAMAYCDKRPEPTIKTLLKF